MAQLRSRRESNLADAVPFLDHPFGLHTLAASRAAEPGFARMFARVQQVSASRSAAVAERSVLVQVPTLVTFTEAAPFDRDAGRYLAAHITNVRVVTQPGVDLYPSPDNVGELGATIEEFLTGVRPVLPADRVLAAVLFTDIAAATERIAAIGDLAWRNLLDRFQATVRDELHRFRGRKINTRGDDFLATFDGPARAVRCAFAIRAAVAHLGVEVRSGLHAGEVELLGDHIGGIAVHIGARVCALAGPGEVLVTSIVRDLVAGSGLRFVDHGRHTLKGVPGEWTILAVAP